jgi:DUF1016 N-terminal domain
MKIEKRTAYGKALLEELSNNLRKDFGIGYSAPHIRNMRQFYLLYPRLDPSLIRYALRSEFLLNQKVAQCVTYV